MHTAHQKLFSKLCSGGAIVVIQTSYANLTPKTFRSLYTSFPIFYYPLENIKKLQGKEFIDLLCEEFPALEKIVVGYDFHFGFKAAYSIKELKEFFKGEVVVVNEHKIDNISVHSRYIREYLRDGQIKQANLLLGHNYTLRGFHINGQGIGKKQFVATINLEVEDFLLPQSGIYITKTKIKDTVYCSVSFLGHRVSTDGKFAVETHILTPFSMQDQNFKFVQLEFLEKIRDNKKYENTQDLKKQILKDIAQAKSFFAL